MQSSTTECDWKLKIGFEKASVEMQSLLETFILSQGTLQSHKETQKPTRKPLLKTEIKEFRLFFMTRKTEFRM